LCPKKEGSLLKDILITLRPRQWLKNIVIFAGLIFSQNFFDPAKDLIVFSAVLIFCLASSSIYLINDALDIEADRNHPHKRHRLIASGRLSLKIALPFASLLMLGSVAAAYLLNRNFAFVLMCYLTIEMFYSLYFKNIVILDIFCIAAGFLLRVISGAVVIDVPISSWLLICTIFLSLFLALGKRRSEMVFLEEEAKKHRRVLSEYSLSFIDQMITIVSASTILSYVLYTLSSETVTKFHTKNLQYTIAFVVYGIFRYLYLIYQKKEGGSPEKLLFSDKPLLVNLMLYALVVVFVIYHI
jgi:4-hydroxybenzoate polyprenyltransferase